ncbi:hypothetical protein IQ255_07745 [Pleurocapsales cyanobacterium LEGE 10410]|nr:hypothetical protein [Pleurocapsales cyanobacterium LEGE 10410]
MDSTNSSFPLDSSVNKRQTHFNFNGFVTVIDRIPEWKGFTAEQYFNQYWGFELGEVDKKFFWLKYSDDWDEWKKVSPRFNPNNPEKVMFAARSLLLQHMLESFAENPEHIGEFFKKMLFVTSELIEEVPHDNALLCVYGKYKESEVYQTYLRPHLYEVLRNNEVGNITSKRLAIYVLVTDKSEVQVYPILRRLLVHSNTEIRWAAQGAIKTLNRSHPGFEGLYKPIF